MFSLRSASRFTRTLCAVILVLSVSALPTVPRAFAQSKDDKRLTKQLKQQAEKDRKAQEQEDKSAERRATLRRKIQPLADQYSRLMLRRAHWDPLVQGYLNSVGQSMVPPETPSSVTFVFRAIDDFRPNASALPDGRIYITTGTLAFVENEAQLAAVLAHEMAHVLEEHTIDSLEKQAFPGLKRRFLGAAAGGVAGGVIGGLGSGSKKGAAVGAGVGAAAGFALASIVDTVIRARYGREQEKEADLIAAELTMARSFEPEEGAKFFDLLHDRFGNRTFSFSEALFGTHPPSDIRAANIRNVLSNDLRPMVESKRSGGELSTGTGRFGRLMSGLIRDNGILLAERSDRHDLALGNLEMAQRYRPNDPRLLWSLGRVYRMLGRTENQLSRAKSLLVEASQADKRSFYPAIYRDLAYLHATHANDFEAATESLKQYVLGHIAIHRTYPNDLEEVYDHMVLFGENAWVAPRIEAETVEGHFSASIWDTPARGLSEYDKAFAELRQAYSDTYSETYSAALSE